MKKEDTDRQRFQLWNDCKPVGLRVGELSEDAVNVGITRERILGVARIFMEDSWVYEGEKSDTDNDADNAYLYISVTVARAAYKVHVHFVKLVFDSISKVSSYASVWSIGEVGTYKDRKWWKHKNQVGYIIASIGRLVRTFVDEYSHVNKKHD